MVELGQVLVINNKKYIIVKLKEFYDVLYAFLSNVDDDSDFFFGKFVNDKLIEVTDERFINLLLHEM